MGWGLHMVVYQSSMYRICSGLRLGGMHLTPRAEFLVHAGSHSHYSVVSSQDACFFTIPDCAAMASMQNSNRETVRPKCTRQQWWARDRPLGLEKILAVCPCWPARPITGGLMMQEGQKRRPPPVPGCPHLLPCREVGQLCRWQQGPPCCSSAFSA